jgi:hypothetical protein
LPLIIFWNAATGHPQAGAALVFAIATLAAAEIDRVRIGSDTEKFILSFLSILALAPLWAPDSPMQAEGNFEDLKRRHR